MGSPHPLAGREEVVGNGLLKGVGFLLVDDENILEFLVVVAEFCELFKVTGLYIKEWNLWYVNYISTLRNIYEFFVVCIIDHKTQETKNCYDNFEKYNTQRLILLYIKAY